MGAPHFKVSTMALYAIVYDENNQRKFVYQDGGEAFFGFDRSVLTDKCAELIKRMKWQLDGSPVRISGFLSDRIEKTEILTPEVEARYRCMLDSVRVIEITSLKCEDGYVLKK